MTISQGGTGSLTLSLLADDGGPQNISNYAWTSSAAACLSVSSVRVDGAYLYATVYGDENFSGAEVIYFYINGNDGVIYSFSLYVYEQTYVEQTASINCSATRFVRNSTATLTIELVDIFGNRRNIKEVHINAVNGIIDNVNMIDLDQDIVTIDVPVKDIDVSGSDRLEINICDTAGYWHATDQAVMVYTR